VTKGRLRKTATGKTAVLDSKEDCRAGEQRKNGRKERIDEILKEYKR